jgi:hypothetical protein
VAAGVTIVAIPAALAMGGRTRMLRGPSAPAPATSSADPPEDGDVTDEAPQIAL